MVRTIADPVEGEGPLAGLVTGLEQIASPRAAVVACDMPLLVPAVVSRLLSLQGEADACVPRVAGMPVPTCAVYAARVAPVACQQLATRDRSLRGLLARLAVRWVSEDELRDVDPALASFCDCDTPEDYAAALALLRNSRS
jgi:molybdopterin-guanine dinucleotide biosynthesis protein A